MAKKETTKKTAKKITKKVEKKKEIMNEELEKAVEEAAPVEQEDITPAEVEAVNGDPAVVVPEEALVEEQKEIVQQEVIKPQKSTFKSGFGYIWNGQEMDY